jgi:hypothetical protein
MARHRGDGELDPASRPSALPAAASDSDPVSWRPIRWAWRRTRWRWRRSWMDKAATSSRSRSISRAIGVVLQARGARAEDAAVAFPDLGTMYALPGTLRPDHPIAVTCRANAYRAARRPPCSAAL